MSRRARFVLMGFIAYMTLIVFCVGQAIENFVQPHWMFLVWVAGTVILVRRMTEMLRRYERGEEA